MSKLGLTVTQTSTNVATPVGVGNKAAKNVPFVNSNAGTGKYVKWSPITNRDGQWHPVNVTLPPNPV